MKPGQVLRPKAGSQRVAVLFTCPAQPGVLSAKELEAEDLTANAHAIAQALRGLGHVVKTFRFGLDVRRLARALTQFGAKVVFNLAETPLGAYEKEPHAAALLELLGLPYTGNGPTPLVLCKNKALTKQILGAHGIATPRFAVYEAVPTRQPALAFPMVVKPLRQDGSLGITDDSVVTTAKQLREGVRYILETHRQEALVEEFVAGREFNVSVLGNGTAQAPYRVLPPGELVYHSPQWRVCTFDAKWDETHPSYAAVEAVYPAALSIRLRRQLERMTIACARVFELSGYSRLDFRLADDGQPYLLDINPNPDVAPHMGTARAAETAGLEYGQFMQEILDLGLAQGAR